MTWRLYCIFFISGAVALIFENLWFHLSNLIFGNSVWSAAIILSGFMAGLALGNYLATIYGDNISNTVFLYAMLELLIGITGILLVNYLPYLPIVLAPLFSTLQEYTLILILTRFIIIFLLLLIPTTAMGATLPIMVKSFHKLSPNFGSTLGKLYGINTFGAVAGVLLCEIILIKYLGITNSGLIATTLNFIAAFMALRIASSMDNRDLKISLTSGSKKIINTTTKTFNIYILTAFFSGMFLLSMELLWFRFLLFFKFGTSLIFAIMLAIVLFGISMGGLITSKIYKRNIRLTKYIKEALLLAAIFTLFTYAFFYDFYKSVSAVKLAFLTPYYNDLVIFTACSVFLMLPVSFISGMLFTMLGAAIKSEKKEDAESVGFLTLANTAGAAIGALIAGLLLLPRVGMEKSFYLIGFFYVLTSIANYLYTENKKLRFNIPSSLMIIFYLLLLVFYPSGKIYEIVKDRYPEAELLELREGQVATNMYIQYKIFGRPHYEVLVTNSHAMSGNNTLGKRYMQLFVYLPLAIHNNIKDTLLISFGIGTTAKALTNTPYIESIDMVDISKDVFEMNEIINPGTSNPTKDDRVTLYIEDGRNFLLTSNKKYDLITAEPPPPAGANVANLYTQEYFQLVYNNLNEGGITSYWLPVHVLKITDTESIIKAFCIVFDDCTLWTGAALDWILLGTRNHINKASTQHFNSLWQNVELKKDLNTIGVEDPYQLGATFLADAKSLKNITIHSLPLTDNYPQRISPVADYSESNKLIYFNYMNEDVARERFQNSEFIAKHWPDTIRENSLEYFRYQKPITNYFDPDYRNSNDNEYIYLHKVLTNTKLETLPLWLLDSSAEEQNIIKTLIEEHGHSEKFSYDLAKYAISQRDYKSAIKYLEEYLISNRSENNTNIISLYLYTLILAGDTSGALDYLDATSEIFKPTTQFLDFIEWLIEQDNVYIPEILVDKLFST